MNKYKVQFHCHTKSDPEDWLFHSDEKLIDHAANYKYDVLSITCHNKIVYSKELAKYAEEKNILLIPGIEKAVDEKHVIIINAHEDAERICTFEDLSLYRKKHPESLIIAPHPYHPVPIKKVSLHEKLDKNIDLFDAIEFSSFHTKIFKFNKKAEKKSKIFKKPLIATSDDHVLSLIKYSYSYVYAPEKTIKSIISAVKKGNVQCVVNPLNTIGLACMTIRLTTLEFIKRISKKIKNILK